MHLAPSGCRGAGKGILWMMAEPSDCIAPAVTCDGSRVRLTCGTFHNPDTHRHTHRGR